MDGGANGTDGVAFMSTADVVAANLHSHNGFVGLAGNHGSQSGNSLG